MSRLEANCFSEVTGFSAKVFEMLMVIKLIYKTVMCLKSMGFPGSTVYLKKKKHSKDNFIYSQILITIGHFYVIGFCVSC